MHMEYAEYTPNILLNRFFLLKKCIGILNTLNLNLDTYDF